MVVKRDGHQNRVYYHCSKYFRPWVENPCNYSKFVPGNWDDLVWSDICIWLRDDAWVEQQLTSEQSQDENTGKLIRFQQWNISQTKAKIAKVQAGFEGGIYTLDEAKRRIAGYQETIAEAEKEIQRLQESMKARSGGRLDIETMREELKTLRDRNLEEATFEEKLDIVSKLGIKVYPSEDLRLMRVLCQLNLDQLQSDGPSGKIESSDIQADGESESATECRKVLFGS